MAGKGKNRHNRRPVAVMMTAVSDASILTDCEELFLRGARGGGVASLPPPLFPTSRSDRRRTLPIFPVQWSAAQSRRSNGCRFSSSSGPRRNRSHPAASTRSSVRLLTVFTLICARLTISGACNRLVRGVKRTLVSPCVQ